MISFNASSVIISRLVSLALGTRKIRRIIVTQKNGNTHEYHPPLNLYFYAQRGSMKSTMAKQIAKTVGATVVTNATAPSIDGTIDSDNKGAVKSIAWELRGKGLLLDEFDMGRSGDYRPIKNTLLQLSEGGELTKTIGIKINKDIELKDGDQYFKVKENIISIRVLLPIMLFTMFEPVVRGEYDEALYSRFIMYRYGINKTELRQVLDGNKLLKIQDIIPKKSIVRIPTRTYQRIIKYVDDIIGDRDDKDLYLRILQDCCKVYAVLGRHSEVDYRLMIELRLSRGKIIEKTIDANGNMTVTEESLERTNDIINKLNEVTKEDEKKRRSKK